MALDDLKRATDWLLAQLKAAPNNALAGATPYLRLFGNTAGGCMLAEEAVAALRVGNGAARSAERVALARFCAENIVVQSGGLASAVTDAADSVITAPVPEAAA